MDINREVLLDRGCIRISGEERVSFLQGLLTNDAERLNEGEATFAALLSPQGKILFDFIVVKLDDCIYLDCWGLAVSDIVKRLSFYKLRANVTIENVSDRTSVTAIWGKPQTQPPELDGFTTYRDPRLKSLGIRMIAENRLPPEGIQNPPVRYEKLRIAAAIPECGKDYQSGEVFAHDACLDLLHGVDFKKGCYVGQEIVSRMQHRGTARTRVLGVKGSSDLPVDRPDITAEGFSVGKLGSVAGDTGIALLRLDRVKEALGKGETFKAGDVDINVSVPEWATYSLND